MPTAKKRLQSFCKYAALIILILIFIFPLYWMVVTALTPKGSLLETSSIFPKTITFDNFLKIISGGQLPIWFRNSAVVTLLSTTIAITISSLAAYSISRFRYFANNALGFFLLIVRMLPETLLIVPLYIIFSKLGLIDSLASLVISDVTFVIPFATWMMKGFFDTIPISLEEAAQIDGCSMFQAARRVILPLTVSGLAAVGIYSAILNWSEYLFARTMITSPQKWMITVGISSYLGEHMIVWGEIMAAAALSVLPIIFVFTFLIKYLISGMTTGAVKE